MALLIAAASALNFAKVAGTQFESGGSGASVSGGAGGALPTFQTNAPQAAAAPPQGSAQIKPAASSADRYRAQLGSALGDRIYDGLHRLAAVSVNLYRLQEMKPPSDLPNLRREAVAERRDVVVADPD